MYITSPEEFADLFNTKIPDAHRKITSNDVCLMTECNLIGKYKFYGRQDLETVRGILQYEQLRETPSATQRPAEYQKRKLKKCKMCGQALFEEPEGKIGRPREYCYKCETKRSRDRQKKSRLRSNMNKK
jgi:hypothetical protein